ncbi:Crp/Fnr family transcriptional regulator [Virgibacillus ihumii]|uniref:Crp/Fnr family transcriptional regulator n=1 Tax=Virgibacillus ihumii TaxID=2686091 RepID=UPI00157CB7D7|nr:Crp/Fnr family transcriptional regulator [Virgibacillus ihumii]
MSNLFMQTSSWIPYLKYGERNYYKRKSVIYQEKEDGCNGFYYLKQGLVKVSSTIHTGEENIIDIVCNEKSFGEQSVDGELYFSTATAIEDSVVYFFPYKNIEPVLERDAQFKMLIYTNLTEKLKTLSNNVLFHTLHSEKLLARTILTLREKFVSKQIPFTQQELCCYTNLNRTTIYNIFKKWDNDVVYLTNRNIIINNTEALIEIAAI